MTEPKLKIFHLDDEEMILAIARTALKGAGYEVISTSDPSRLDEVLTGDFALVIVDLLMPEVNGFQVCRRLREGGYAKGILVLSSKTLSIDERRVLNELHVDFLPKPFGPRNLIETVRRCIAEGAWKQT